MDMQDKYSKAGKIIRECLVFVDKAIALISENKIHGMLCLMHNAKFSPAKISRYTVLLYLSANLD